MTHVIKFAFWFAAGYFVTSKALPAIQAKIESINLDDVWEIWDEQELM